MIEPRWYQEACIQSVFDYFESGKNGNPVAGLPTGTGKGLVIATLCRRILNMWAGQRILNLTHVKELIQQNYDELLGIWPEAPAGIYSSGLKKRQFAMPVVFGGIGSVFRKADIFGHRDLVLIDECHLLSQDEDSMYHKAIKALKEINPYLKVIGFSATLFRMRQGSLVDEGLFTDICFDMTDMAGFNRLIAEGYMCNVVAAQTETEIDTTGVRISNGEFNESDLEKQVDKIMYEGVGEACYMGRDRHSWMVFGANIESCEKLAHMFRHYGVVAEAVHSKLNSAENDARIKAFKRGEIKCLVNMNKLTTGFNHPPIDFIADFQPTRSPAKHVQKVGRGTRTFNGKKDLLYGDFARNTLRNGAINNPRIPGKPGEREADVAIKICPSCKAYNHTVAKKCCNCEHEFEFKINITKTASTQEILEGERGQVEFFEVQHVTYSKHKSKKTGKDSLRVMYVCGMKMFSEWLSFGADGFAGKHARDWWRRRVGSEPPSNVEQALAASKYIRKPARIKVIVNQKFPEIIGYEY